jgi:regulator of protease activity HflC (stomatin/prohibitin superfamily)
MVKRLWSRVLLVVGLLGVLLAAAGCEINLPIQANQMGIILRKGVVVSEIVGPGRYTTWEWRTQIRVIDCSAQTVEWEDPDLVSKDKQPLAFRVGVTYARATDAAAITEMWTRYNLEARDNEALARQVLNRVPRVAKAVTTEYTLDEMLARTAIQVRMFELLSAELAEFGVTLLDVGINNISPSPSYMAALEEKAAAQIAVEVAQQRTLTLQEQINQERAQTDIEMERAARDRQVAEERAKVWELNPEAYELERLRLLGEVLGESDKVYFVPQGADLTLLLSGMGTAPVVPVE